MKGFTDIYLDHTHDYDRNIIKCVMVDMVLYNEKYFKIDDIISVSDMQRG